MVVEDLLGAGKAESANVAAEPDGGDQHQENANALGDVVQRPVGGLVWQGQSIALR